MNLDPREVEGAITPRTRVLLPVHFAGRPVDIDGLAHLARVHHLRVIEDAAHAVGAAWKGSRIGSTADYTCFSFYATKNLTTGEGGMVTTALEDRADWLRVASLHGMSRDAWKRYHADGVPQYDVVMAGFKYNMTDLQAAMGLQQLARLTRMHQRRDAIWRAYDEALADVPIERPAPVAPDTVHARHLYTVLVDERRSGWTRDALQQALQERGIGTSIHFRALHLHPFYAERFGFRRGMFPNAEYISDRTLSLPLSAAMTDEEVDRTIEAVRDLVNR
jgi:dTDP-4-amino-4,6-dideoxygalactose transaminase